MNYDFDRYLTYDELRRWLSDLAEEHPNLIEVETYGRSYEGKDLLLATITDRETGLPGTKPAHWVDASIHAIELTATVAACYLIHRLVEGFGADAKIDEALRTRTFYVVPRVNPDGAEWALASQPKFRRSSTRAWPWTDGHRWPGLENIDVDGDGRILQMRIPDPDGAWMPHPEDARLMVPVPGDAVGSGIDRYRLLDEGTIENYDGFTVPTPNAVEGLDLNRNFPAGWSPGALGAGDHPLSEPEVEALVKAIQARPNICGYNAFHTCGGILLRPSSVHADAKIDATDLWVMGKFGERCTELTGYPCHSVFEDFTWDQAAPISGAADDWAYEHLGIFGWTTEFWDFALATGGGKLSTHFWYTGPTNAQALNALRWCDDHYPDGYVDWYPFDHPQLGPIELGGWDYLSTWLNPPPSQLRDEVAPHADFAIHQALCSPKLRIVEHRVETLGADVWRIEVGVINAGWLPTDVSSKARKEKLTLPLTLECEADGSEVTILDGPARRQLGQLEGRMTAQFGQGNDGTPERVLTAWTVRAPTGTTLRFTAAHPRAGSVSGEVVVG